MSTGHQSIVLEDDLVLRRKTAGARAVLWSRTELNDIERRLLLTVNGYTPLRTLLDLNFVGDDAQQAIEDLLAKGGVEAVPAFEPPPLKPRPESRAHRPAGSVRRDGRQEGVRDWLADKEKKAKIEVLLGPAAKPKMSHPQSATRYLEMIATAEQSVDDLFAVQQ
jgi:hypothetical protein